MTTHVIEVEIRRFYKVYVDDENDVLSEKEAEQLAREQIETDGEAVLSEDIELNEVEKQDILALYYDYPIL